MPLPLNTQTTIGGVAVVVKSTPERSSGPNTGPSDRPDNGADQSVSAYSGAPSGSNNSYRKPPKGLNIPDFSGLDKALGYLGAAVALGNAAVGLFQAGKNLFKPGVPLTNVEQVKLRGDLLGRSLATQSSIPDSTTTSKDNRVKIWTDFDVFGPNPYFSLLKDTGGVIFPYTPNITLTYKANYTQQEGIVHNNFPYQAYKNSQIEDITIQSEFTIQNNKEGEYWLAAMSFFRTATKMFYGASTPQGFPPVLCSLRGFGNEILPNVPVVIKSFQLDLKDSVQYMSIQGINSKDEQLVPMVSTVTIICSPVYSRAATRKFDIKEFARGNLLGYM